MVLNKGHFLKAILFTDYLFVSELIFGTPSHILNLEVFA